MTIFSFVFLSIYLHYMKKEFSLSSLLYFNFDITNKMGGSCIIFMFYIPILYLLNDQIYQMQLFNMIDLSEFKRN